MTQFSDPPALQSLASTAALIAACVAFVSFLFNYRSTLRSQRDTQFYEAMKRFGDKDSPALRSSAAGLLGQFATAYPKAYLNTAFQQLLAGLFLESNRMVLRSITDAIIQTIPSQPLRAANSLADLNKLAEKDFLAALMEVLADEMGERTALTFGDAWIYLNSYSDLTQLEILSGFNVATVAEILKDYKAVYPLRNAVLFEFSNLSDITRNFDTSGESAVLLHRHHLQDASERLRTICALLEKASTFGYKPWIRILSRFAGDSLFFFSDLFLAEHSFYMARWCGIGLSSANFVNVRLDIARFEHVDINHSNMCFAKMNRTQFVSVRFTYVNLEGGELMDASFSRVVMSDVNLKDTKMWGLQLGNGCDLSEANWWEADFFYPTSQYYHGGKSGKDGDIDHALLTKLFSDHSPRLACDHAYGGHSRRKLNPSPIHASVLRFIESTESGIREQTMWVNELRKLNGDDPVGE